MSRSTLALVSLALVACEKVDPCSLAEEATMTVGTGEEAFTELVDGQRLPTEWGAQGGQHAWIAVRTHGVDPGKLVSPTKNPGPTLHTTLETQGLELGSGDSYERPLRGDPEQAELTGLQTFLDPWVLEENDLDDGSDDAVLTVTLTDRCGTSLTTSFDVRWRD